jgi:hypothetical protein
MAPGCTINGSSNGLFIFEEFLQFESVELNKKEL